MKQCNKIVMLTIMASLMLSGCKVNTNEPEETPEEIALPSKEVDFWNGEYAYKIDENRTVYLTNVEREDSEKGRSKSIIEATIPEIVTNQEKEYTVIGIGEGAFMFCDNLQEVTLPDSIREIDEYAFSDCKKLVSINFPKNLEHVKESAFTFSGLKEIEFSDKLIQIEEYAFGFCDNIKKVEIPESLEELRHWSFSTCEGIGEVTIRASKLNMDKGAFYNCKSLKTFYVPKESLEYYKEQLSEYNTEIKVIEE